MITGGDLRQSRLNFGYKTFTISPWSKMVPIKEQFSLPRNNRRIAYFDTDISVADAYRILQTPNLEGKVDLSQDNTGLTR